MRSGIAARLDHGLLRRLACRLRALERHEHGLRVAVWIDAGNQTSPHYTWDAAGVRFFTTEARLQAFLADLIKP